MGSFIARQPNGLLCRFSTVVDAVTHINLTEKDYIELCAEQARKDAERNLKSKHFVEPFDRVLEYTRYDNMTYDEWQGYLKEMGYNEPELPFKPGDEVLTVNQIDPDMNGRKAVVERAYPNKRTNKIDVEIRFDDEQDSTYMYNGEDLVKEEEQ